METMNIKLYDNEQYDYPIIKIRSDALDKFKNELDKYRENDEYNIDDFIDIISTKEWFVECICEHKRIYF